MQRDRTPPISLSVQEVAALLNVDERTIRRGLSRGQVPGKKIGRIWRIPRTYVLQFSQAEEVTNEPPQTIEHTSAASNRPARNG